MDLVWPQDFSTATVAEFVAEEDFSRAILAEKSLLPLKVLCQGYGRCPLFRSNREEVISCFKLQEAQNHAWSDSGFHSIIARRPWRPAVSSLAPVFESSTESGDADLY